MNLHYSKYYEVLTLIYRQTQGELGALYSVLVLVKGLKLLYRCLWLNVMFWVSIRFISVKHLSLVFEVLLHVTLQYRIKDGGYFPNPKTMWCYKQAPLIFHVFLHPYTMCIKKSINKRTLFKKYVFKIIRNYKDFNRHFT